jgi:arginine N-succinyltransferase
MVRYEIRAAAVSDEDQLLRLAQFLNTVNLPNDREHIQRLLQHAAKSFSLELRERHRKYVFVLWDLERDIAVGTSMIVAQLGRRDAPYIYFDVYPEEKYSNTLDRHFHHTVLRIGFSYDGPTEIGGLIVDPAYRGASERLGLLISGVRFLYMAVHRELFRNEILAELLPPLEPDGTSHLWEALGRHFTGMSYAEADVLSSENKSFIRDLFPSGPIYASLLSQDAQDVIGKVGAQTKGVEKLLRRIGFRYAERIDPFDGGPHFVAPADEISMMQATRTLPFTGTLAPSNDKPTGLVAREFLGPPYFRAAPARFQIEGSEVRVDESVALHLGLTPGDPISVLPLLS